MATTRHQFLGVILVGLLFSSCGYTLRQKHNPLVEVEGIRTLYIAPVVNNSYKPGVETVLYNQLLKTIGAYHRVQLTQSKLEADAILKATIQKVEYSVSASQAQTEVFPKSTYAPQIPAGMEELKIATHYSSEMSADFELIRRQVREGQSPKVWGGSFGGSKDFVGSNQKGAFGSSAALINESEFDRCINDLSFQIAADLHESMFVMF